MGYGDEEYLLPKSSSRSHRKNEGYDSIRFHSTGRLPQDEKRGVGAAATILPLLRTVPSVFVLAFWNIMMSVPFGSMFFSDDVPLSTHTKEKLGMRLSMMALGVGQSVMGGWLTGFHALTVWELAEVAPFYEAFAALAARSCGDDPSRIYPTTVYLISLSTIAIGIGYFVCGYFRIGKFLSFFPSYVTLGLIAGVGVWAATISMTVSASSHILEDREGAAAEWWDYAVTPHFCLSLVLGLGIRPLRKVFPDFLLLDPVYFLSIPIVFHVAIAVLGIGFDQAVDAGYMFKAPLSDTAGVVDEEPSIWEESGELWTLFDPSKVQWEVALQAAPQIFAASILAIMISAPFIPPIATICDTQGDFSPDKEFVAHGISNMVSGLLVPGGMPVCACYSSTVLYCNSGGGGRFPNFLLTCTSFVSFVYGPFVAGYLPRCMASSILIDIAIALFLEGVADDSHKCDPVEYTSIWIILTVMTVFDMTSGLIAGLFMALFTSTYSIGSDDPVRRVCDAETFPSSRHRKDSELAILENSLTGRKNIAIFQLQGSLFFGNISKIQDRLFDFLEKRGTENTIVIFDCTLVSSLDSSACIFFDKIQSMLQNDYGVAATVFVSSPPKLELEKAADQQASSRISFSSYRNKRSSLANKTNLSNAFSERGRSDYPRARRSSAMTTRGSYGRTFLQQDIQIHGTCFDFLDKALASCEDKLLSLAASPGAGVPVAMLLPHVTDFSDIDNDDPERAEALQMLKDYCNTEDMGILKSIVDAMKREALPKGSILWNLGDSDSSAKLFLSGSVFAYVLEDGDDKRFRASMATGSFLGLGSLVLNERHLTAARCDEDSVFFSLDKNAYDKLVRDSPQAARVLELSMARYLSHRLRHVSNRIYQARSVPV